MTSTGDSVGPGGDADVGIREVGGTLTQYIEVIDYCMKHTLAGALPVFVKMGMENRASATARAVRALSG